MLNSVNDSQTWIDIDLSTCKMCYGYIYFNMILVIMKMMRSFIYQDNSFIINRHGLTTWYYSIGPYSALTLEGTGNMCAQTLHFDVPYMHDIYSEGVESIRSFAAGKSHHCHTQVVLELWGKQEEWVDSTNLNMRVWVCLFLCYFHLRDRLVYLASLAQIKREGVPLPICECLRLQVGHHRMPKGQMYVVSPASYESWHHKGTLANSPNLQEKV